MKEFLGIELSQLTGIVAGILTASSLVPQLVKTVRKKKADDVSVNMILLLLAGLALWVLYGILKKDTPILITNSFSLLVNICLLIFRFKYARNKG